MLYHFQCTFYFTCIFCIIEDSYESVFRISDARSTCLSHFISADVVLLTCSNFLLCWTFAISTTYQNSYNNKIKCAITNCTLFYYFQCVFFFSIFKVITYRSGLMLASTTATIKLLFVLIRLNGRRSGF